ncbi:MAG: hypothetical protein NWF09_08910 [Candidatus Bathyarchaeota archaeon]|nr:hypothetical protein [Candidatus Bathyarchaeota archaeon]
MSEKLLGKIEELLCILKHIVDDLETVSRELKVKMPAQSTKASAQSTVKAPASIAEVKSLFRDELRELLDVSEKDGYFIIKPKHYLGADNFSEIAGKIRDVGGEYVSAGKNSYFRIPMPH